MMDTAKAIVIIVGFFFFSVVCMYAADVGKARAKADEECFKAAQVNQNIHCEASK
jgi:hypothetical protein